MTHLKTPKTTLNKFESAITASINDEDSLMYVYVSSAVEVYTRDLKVFLEYSKC